MAPTNLLSFQDSSTVDMDPDLSWEFASSPQGKFHRRFSREFGKANLVIQTSHEVLLITKENTDCFRVCESLFVAVEINILVKHC